MRDLIRQITAAYTSTKLEGQDAGTVVLSAREPGTKQSLWIKVLPRVLGQDPKIATRFRGLAQTIRQLNHPNIASVQAVGEKAGLPYIVTRAIERAQPLAARLDQPWAVDAAADLVMQVGQALEHAYDKGLVHGLLSPQNILVQEDGRVKVTDFGVSALLNLVGAQLKQAASPYLAPERVAGKPIDARVDVYSLAAILYGLLAGRAPQVVQGQVLPPGRFNPDVPPDMDRVIVKALAANPGDRYPDVKSFLAALGAVTLAPLVVEAGAATPTLRCPKCGTTNQTGRFCRKCGARLAWPEPPAPSQPVPRGVDEAGRATALEVGSSQVGKGGDSAQVLAPGIVAAAAGESAARFPEPLPMPQLNLDEVWARLASESKLIMPEPPPMPVIDWAALAPPTLEMPTIEQDQPRAT